MGFPILVRWYLYIESGSWMFPLGTTTCNMTSRDNYVSDKLDLKEMAVMHPDYTPTRDCRQNSVIGTHFTDAFSITIPIRVKFRSTGNPFLATVSLQIYAHTTKAPLLCFMQIVVVRERSLIDSSLAQKSFFRKLYQFLVNQHTSMEIIQPFTM